MAEGFDLSVMRLCSAVMSDPTGAQSHDLVTIQSVLAQAIRSVHHRLEPHEIADIADEAIFRFVTAIKEGRINIEQRPAGYLVSIARNLSIDRGRRPVPAPLDDWDAAEEDKSLPIIEALSHRDAVRTAIRRAREASDHSVTRVVIAWRVLHDELGRAPTSREVSRRADLSHTAVLNTLQRARNYFDDRP